MLAVGAPSVLVSCCQQTFTIVCCVQEPEEEPTATDAERQRAKSLKFAELDRRAGIDRRLVYMSAAEKRMLERKEREKKEAELRR